MLVAQDYRLVLLLIGVIMAGYNHPFQVEVRGLAGRLGVVSLGPGRVTAWDLVKQVHSEFQPPSGMFLKLVIDDEPLTEKDIVITSVSAVTCVKCSPAKDKQEDAVRAVELLLCDGRSLDALPLETHLIWNTLQSLTFGNHHGPGVFQSMDNVALPSGLQSLTFGYGFNQSMDNVTLPSGLQSLTFGNNFNQRMDNVALPSGLQSLTFGYWFNKNMDNVALPSGLQSLTFRYRFNQKMDNVALPSGFQSLTFGTHFNQSMANVALPSSLQSLTFGNAFNHSMDNVTLPSGLQSLTFGACFNQSMVNVTLPSGLQSLTFGARFNQSMDNVALPSGLQSLNCPASCFSDAKRRRVTCPIFKML